MYVSNRAGASACARARSLYLSLFCVPLLPYNVLSPTLSANVDELVRGACDALKDMYRYNRVMIYRFHEDYHGTYFSFFPCFFLSFLALALCSFLAVTGLFHSFFLSGFLVSFSLALALARSSQKQDTYTQ